MTEAIILSNGNIRITQGSDRITVKPEDAPALARKLEQLARDATQLRDKKWAGRGVSV